VTSQYDVIFSRLQTNILAKFVDTACIFRDARAAVGKQSHRHVGILWVFPPQTKLQATPNWIMKHYKSVEVLSNFIMFGILVATRSKTLWNSDIHTNDFSTKNTVITSHNWKRCSVSNGDTPYIYRRFVRWPLWWTEHVDTWFRHHTIWDHSRSYWLIYINPLQDTAPIARLLPWNQWQT